MSRIPSRIVLIQVAILLAFIAPLVAVGGYVWHKHAWAQARLDELEPRHARLQGVRDLLPDLEKATQNAQTKLAQSAYPATTDITKAGNDVQQRIRSVFESSQLAIVSIQVLEPKEEEGFQRIRVTLQAEGTLSKFQEAAIRLKDLTPLVMVDGFSFQSVGAVRPASTQSLVSNFDFSVLRSKS
jgi:general secretion pathway protein M